MTFSDKHTLDKTQNIWYNIGMDRETTTRTEIKMTLGAIAELKVKDYKVLNDPLLHRIPTRMMIERAKIDLEVK